MDIFEASLDEIKAITASTCFLNSSFRLLDGYFSFSNYEAQCQTSNPLFIIKINDNTTYLIKITSLNKENNSLCFKLFQVSKADDCVDHIKFFEYLSAFLMKKFNVSRIYTYILSSEIAHLKIISKTMLLEASLEEPIPQYDNLPDKIQYITQRLALDMECWLREFPEQIHSWDEIADTYYAPKDRKVNDIIEY
ncbi:MAG: hypothetical protein ACJA0T_002955 [Colwellia sp.]|jgi:hypothetical protein